MPKMRGLHDFPEVAPVGSAETATNVEFRFGGVSRRRGTQRLVQVSKVGQIATLRGRGVWGWERPSGEVVIVVAYLSYLDGLVDGNVALYDTSGRLLPGDFHVAADPGPAGAAKWNLRSHQHGEDFNFADNDGLRRPWLGVVYQPGYQSDNYFILTVPSHKPAASTMWVIAQVKGGKYMLGPVVPIDRDSTNRYWGGWVDLGVAGDDAQPYLVPVRDAADDALNPLRDNPVDDPNNFLKTHNGRLHNNHLSPVAMVVYRGRVVVGGNDGHGSIHGTREQQAVRFSNFGDLAVGINGSGDPFGLNPINNLRNEDYVWGRMGWPAHNVAFFSMPDPTPVTGLSVWRDFLLVFKTRSVSMCRFTGIEDFVVLQVTQGSGSVAHRTIKNIPRTAGGHDVVMYLGEDGVYAWDGEPKYISRHIELRLRPLRATFSEAWALVYPEANQYWLFVPVKTPQPGISYKSSGVTTETRYYDTLTGYRVFVLDYIDMAWSEFAFSGVLRAGDAIPNISNAPSSVVPVTLRDTSHDQLSEMMLQVHDIGGTDDGDGEGLRDINGVGVAGPPGDYENRKIAGSWFSQRWRFTFHQLRRWVFVRLTMGENGSDAESVRVEWRNDNQGAAQGRANGQEKYISGQGGGGSTFGNMTFGNARFLGLGHVTKRVAVAKGGPCRHFRFGLSTDDPSGFHVTSAEADTRRKPGRR